MYIHRWKCHMVFCTLRCTVMEFKKKKKRVPITRSLSFRCLTSPSCSLPAASTPRSFTFFLCPDPSLCSLDGVYPLSATFFPCVSAPCKVAFPSVTMIPSVASRGECPLLDLTLPSSGSSLLAHLARSHPSGVPTCPVLCGPQ